MALIAMAVYSKQEPQIFHNSRLLLNTTFGASNTLFLITIGFFMVLSVQYFKENKLDKTKIYLKLTMLVACCF